MPSRLIPCLSRCVLILIIVSSHMGRSAAESIVYANEPLPDKPLVIRASVSGKGRIWFTLSQQEKTGLFFPADGPGELVVIRPRGGGHTRGYLDGRPVIPSAGPGGNWMGVSGISLNNLVLQDNATPHFGDDFMRDAEESGLGDKWSVESGRITVAHEAQARLAASPFHAVAQGKDKLAAAHAGRWYWNDYLVAGAFEYAGGDVGLDAYRYLKGRIRFVAGKSGMSIVHFDPVSGQAKVKAHVKRNLSPGWHQIGLAVQGRKVSAIVDLATVLEADVDMPCGEAGFFAGGANTRVDDIVVLPLADGDPVDKLREWWGESPTVRTAFQDDREMQLWSRRLGILSYDPRRNMLVSAIVVPPPWKVGFLLPKSQGKLTIAAAGKTIDLECSGQNLLVDGRPVPPGNWECRLSAEARGLGLVIDGNRVADYTVTGSADGAHAEITMSGSLARAVASSVTISGPNVRQFTFYRAPVLFTKLAGTWEDSSLWACSPQYSWFQGKAGTKTAERTALAGYREHLSGNFYVRMVIAVPMAGDQTPYYEYPVNFGVALVPEKGAPVHCLYGLCDVPSAISSGNGPMEINRMYVAGYVGGYVRSSFSFIKQFLHTTWFDLELIRTGDKLTMMRDGAKIVSGEIPGLPEKLSLAWLVGDNLAVISRAEIAGRLEGGAFEGTEPASAAAIGTQYLDVLYSSDPERKAAAALLAGNADAGKQAAPQDTHLPYDRKINEAFLKLTGRRYFAWENIAGKKWFGFSGYDGVEVFGNGTGGDQTSSIRVINRHVGGEMLLPLARENFELNDYPVLEFEYQIPRDSRPGLFMVVNGNRVEVPLVHGFREFGLGLMNDGAVHKAKVNLVDVVQRFGFRGKPPYICEILGFNDAGWQEHTRGDWYVLKNIRLVPFLSKAEAHKLGVDAEGEAECTLDGRKLPILAGNAKSAGKADQEISLEFESRDGKSYPESIDVGCDLSELSPESMVLEIAGSAGAPARFGFGDEAIRWTRKGLQWLAPGASRLPEGPAKITVTALDRAGNRVAVSKDTVFAPELDKTGPPLGEEHVHLSFSGAEAEASFDTGDDWGEVSNRGGMIMYPRLAGDVRCLAVECAQFNQWERFVFLRRTPFDVDELPMLRFRYRLKKNVKGWLGARVGREVLAIFDSHNHRGEDVRKKSYLKDDQEWQTMVVDLRKLLAEYLYRDDMDKRPVEQLFTVTPNWYSRGFDRTIYLDDVALYPENPLKLSVKVDVPHDPAGFGGISWSVDSDADAEAPVERLTGDRSFVIDLPRQKGTFLHVRAFDLNGNAGKSVAVRLFPE
ncbi:MAG: hypothetical protein JW909_11960 [Planctomycetes bacterium]|nr:hypothetical protein [Planctomycetota bacterium]